MYGHPIGTAAQQDAAQQAAAASGRRRPAAPAGNKSTATNATASWPGIASSWSATRSTRTVLAPSAGPHRRESPRWWTTSTPGPTSTTTASMASPSRTGSDRISPTTNRPAPFEQSQTLSPRLPPAPRSVGPGTNAGTGRPFGSAGLARGVAARPSRSPSRFLLRRHRAPCGCWPSLVPRAGRCGPPASGRRPYVFPLPSRRPILTAPHAEPSRARCARPAARQPSSAARCDASRARHHRQREQPKIVRAPGLPRLAGCACALRVSQRTPGGPDRTAPGGGGGWSAGSVPATHSSRSVSPHRVDQEPPQYQEPNQHQEGTLP